MVNPWLPVWLGLAWTAVFAVILVVHLWHAAQSGPRERLWHSTHMLMALGMVVMYAPTEQMLVPWQVGSIVFAVAAAALAAGLAAAWGRGVQLGPLWLVNLVDLAAMAFMFAMMSTRLLWLALLAVAWFALQAAGWATGALTTVLARGGLGAPRRVRVPEPTAVEAPNPGSTSGAREAAQLRHAEGTSHTAHLVSIRVTLTLMALGMGYMFLAMQFGMATVGSMSLG